MFDQVNAVKLSSAPIGEEGLEYLLQAVSYFELDQEPVLPGKSDLAVVDAMYAYFEAA
jgi:hypothetical protein